MTNENDIDIDAATKMADNLINQLDQEEDMIEHNRKSMDGSHEILKVLVKSIQSDIDMIKSEGCGCPACASTIEQFENAKEAVQDVETGFPVSVESPMEASFILGTASCLCAFMPAMIAALLKTNITAHETIATVIKSRIELVTCEKDDTNNDSAKKPN